MTGFSHENLENTLKFFREGFLRCNDSQELNEFIVTNFRVFQAIGQEYEGQVHFTGYGTPIYDGSLTPTGEFRYPLYKLPSDFKKSYYTRREIEERGLLKGNEIAYLRSKLDAYLIHVQGSGQIRLSSGEKVYVGYAADSGHKYNSIGRMLVLDGKIPEEELTLTTLIASGNQPRDMKVSNGSDDLTDTYISVSHPAGRREDLGILEKALKSHPSQDVDVEDELLQSLFDLPVFQAQAAGMI